MGIQGLRKFVDGAGISKVLPTPQEGESKSAATAHHVFFDMNGLIHACYSRDHATPQATIDAVLRRLEQILRGVVRPTVTLVLAIDGPAPMMKLCTQRLRRRRARHMDVANAQQFSDLSITAGSPFLLMLEQAVGRWVLQQKKARWLRVANVVVIGSAVPGEGEHKIAQALHHLAPRHGAACDDSVVVIGNDIDLVLTCVGATAFHNLWVVSPQSLQTFDVGRLVRRWCDPEQEGFVPERCLPSARLDFAFLFQLNGGDHYEGCGDVAAGLWRRYRQLRSTMPLKFRLVRENCREVEVQPMFELFSGAQSSGASDSERGAELLRAAIWALQATVKGEVVDYQYECGDVIGVSLPMIRAAVSSMGGPTVRGPQLESRQPLVPLFAMAAVMPTPDALPSGMRAFVHKQPLEWRSLQDANTPSKVFKAAKRLVRNLPVDSLTPAEKFLTQFGEPVDLVGDWWWNRTLDHERPPTKHIHGVDIFDPEVIRAAGGEPADRKRMRPDTSLRDAIAEQFIGKLSQIPSDPGMMRRPRASRTGDDGDAANF